MAYIYQSSAWAAYDTEKYVVNTNTFTTYPFTIKSPTTPINATIYGNMVQTGTPTPTNPIQPSECGERTGNLLAADSTSATVNTVTISNDNGKITVTGRSLSEISSTNSAWKNAFTFKLKAGTYYFAGSSSGGISSYLRNANDDTRISIPNDSFVLSNDTDVYIGFYVYNNNDTTFNIMLNEGSESLSFEPYGYKIPILSGGVTTNVYLGEEQTTRKIKKLVLKGDDTETYTSSYSGDNSFFNYTLSSIGQNVLISTHFTIADISSTSTDVGVRIVSGTNLRVRPENVSGMSVDGFKTWLSTQYAAGTPVTVWYVLAEPTTGIVNEPIRKIGDYADTVTTSIPVTINSDSVDINTTLKPSAVAAPSLSWGAGDDYKRSGGAWV